MPLILLLINSCALELSQKRRHHQVIKQRELQRFSVFILHPPKLILSTKCEKLTVIKLQERLLEQGSGGQLPIGPG